jgi:hypothetical protein
VANFALTNPSIWIHDQDMTGYLKKATMKVSAAELENTTFGSTYRTRIGGLKTVSMQANGYWDSTPDASMFAALGVANRAVTITPQGTATNVAYLWRAGEFVYDAFGTVGEMSPFNISTISSDSQGLVRGQLAAAKTTLASATGQFGSIINLIGPSATQYLYATLHVFTAATTITVIVESAALIGFAGPTTRATIGPITVAGGTWLVRVAGPWTDAFYRLNATTCTGTFVVGGAIGVQ